MAANAGVEAAAASPGQFPAPPTRSLVQHRRAQRAQEQLAGFSHQVAGFDHARPTSLTARTAPLGPATTSDYPATIAS